MPINDLNNNPFKVPDQYFDRLPMVVQERCAQASRGKRDVFAFNPRWAVSAVGLGAVMIGVVGFFSIMDTGVGQDTFRMRAAQSNPYARPAARAANYIGDMVRNSNVFNVGSTNDSRAGLHDMSEIMMNQLAVENLSIEDILTAGY